MSPYKDKTKAREYAKEAMKRSREGITRQGITDPKNVIPEHPVMKYLIDPGKRKKMEAIVLELGKHKQLHNVYLGCRESSLPLDIVGEMLECTR